MKRQLDSSDRCAAPALRHNPVRLPWDDVLRSIKRSAEANTFFSAMPDDVIGMISLYCGARVMTRDAGVKLRRAIAVCRENDFSNPTEELLWSWDRAEICLAYRTVSLLDPSMFVHEDLIRVALTLPDSVKWVFFEAMTFLVTYHPHMIPVLAVHGVVEHAIQAVKLFRSSMDLRSLRMACELCVTLCASRAGRELLMSTGFFDIDGGGFAYACLWHGLRIDGDMWPAIEELLCACDMSWLPPSVRNGLLDKVMRHWTFHVDHIHAPRIWLAFLAAPDLSFGQVVQIGRATIGYLYRFHSCGIDVPTQWIDVVRCVFYKPCVAQASTLVYSAAEWFICHANKSQDLCDVCCLVLSVTDIARYQSGLCIPWFPSTLIAGIRLPGVQRFLRVVLERAGNLLLVWNRVDPTFIGQLVARAREIPAPEGDAFLQDVMTCLRRLAQQRVSS